jgi:GNAT superfamily N-acetyltransferase
VSSIAPTAELLAAVFGGAHTARADYLEWLYERSPFGPVVESNLDDDQGRIGHYAIVPVALSRDGAPVQGALSLNTAVHERARGQGAFVRLASETYAKAGRRGITAVVGVANANSTPGFVGRLGFELVGPLPASVLLPSVRTRGLRSAWADESSFSAGAIAAEVEPLLASPAIGLARAWTTDTLRWRLAQPGGRYALHRGPGVLAVSCLDSRHGVRVAILLKVFASSRLPARARRALVAAACRFHRAPLALHVGLNELVDFHGIPLPERLRESPLNLIYRSLEDEARSTPIVRFEFLDFDAY